MARDYEGLARLLEEIARGCGYAPNRARYQQRAEELRRAARESAGEGALDEAPALETEAFRPRRRLRPPWPRRRR
jgi:hypothetical protein